MFYFLLWSWLSVAISIQKQVILNTDITSSKGASIASNPQQTAINENEYIINVQSQNAYDLKLSLDETWGFKPLINSTVTLIINGHTPFPEKDTDFLIVFSVGDRQYFSFFLHLDTSIIKSRIYAAMDTYNTQNVSEWISNTTQYKQRWNRVSNNNEWTVLNQWQRQSLWPLQFVITNNPIQSKVYFKFYHNTTDTLAVMYTFDASFQSHKAMDIYIMGDSNMEQFMISSLAVLLTANHSIETPFVSTQTEIIPINRIQTEIKKDTNNININIILVLVISLLIALIVVLCLCVAILKKRWEIQAFHNGYIFATNSMINNIQNLTGLRYSQTGTTATSAENINDKSNEEHETESSNISFVYDNHGQHKQSDLGIEMVEMNDRVHNIHPTSDTKPNKSDSSSDECLGSVLKASQFDDRDK